VTPAPLVARTASPAATRDLAAALAAVLRPGDLLLLVGDLGTGKTTFTQGLARGLGVTDRVTSPTFTLLRGYPCGPGPVATLLHADLYRLERLQHVADLGIGEMVEDATGEDPTVAVVEWGDMAASFFGPDALTVGLATGATADQRIVTLSPDGSWTARADALAAALAPWTDRSGPAR
jgi:tRNA threonylcarbamoyladenosine biosynthesis protein TsaE